jgi:hypothetical protein
MDTPYRKRIVRIALRSSLAAVFLSAVPIDWPAHQLVPFASDRFLTVVDATGAHSIFPSRWLFRSE